MELSSSWPETDVNFDSFWIAGCRRQNELERGYCCFAHHAKRSIGCSNQGRDMKFVTGLLAAVLLLAGVGASHAAVLDYRGPWRQDWRLHG